MKPMEIEQASMAIIERELQVALDPEIKPIVKRVIHATADFSFAESMVFTPGVVPYARELLARGAMIVTDTQMARSGINKKILAALGGEAHCFMSDEDVAAEAVRRGTTRAEVSMEKAAKLDKPCIFAIGNAPTALLAIYDLVVAGKLSPALVIGVPVGFVNVVESKERLFAVCTQYGVPAIVAMGRKGGSNVAAAICNALIYSAAEMLDPAARGWQ